LTLETIFASIKLPFLMLIAIKKGTPPLHLTSLLGASGVFMDFYFE